MDEKIFKRDNYIDVYNVDSKRRARAAGLLRQTQECGSWQMATDRPSYEELLDQGKAFMLSRLDMIIYEDVHLDEWVTCYTWPCPSTRATFLRNYTVEKGDRRIALISSQWTMVEPATRKILKVEDVDISNYYMAPYIEAIPGKLKITKDEAMQMELVGTERIRYSDVDYNGHMNNTNYIDMLCDYMPEVLDGSKQVCALRIHFSKEAPLGEIISIKRLKKDENTYLFQTFRSDQALNVEAEISIK